MKSFIITLVLSSCTTLCAFAQLSFKKRTVNIEEMRNFSRSYFIDLKAKNSMRIDIYDHGGTALHPNIDSLLDVILESYEAVKDSLAADWNARTLNICLYDTIARTVGWSATMQPERRVMFYDTTKTLIKFVQDTIYMKVYRFIPSTEVDPPFMKITLYLNNIHRLPEYVSGKYTALFNKMDPENSQLWGHTEEGLLYLKSEPAIQLLPAYNEVKKRVKLTFDLSVSVQNYRDRFVPSINTGIGWIIEQYYMQVHYWLGYESDFTFSKDVNGKNRSYANGFVTFSYKTFNIGPNRKNTIGVYPNIKIGWLANRKDIVYDKNTWKLGIGQFAVNKGSLRVEPTFYFHDLFKGLTPGFRITQSL